MSDPTWKTRDLFPGIEPAPLPQTRVPSEGGLDYTMWLASNLNINEGLIHPSSGNAIVSETSGRPRVPGERHRIKFMAVPTSGSLNFGICDPSPASYWPGCQMSVVFGLVPLIENAGINNVAFTALPGDEFDFIMRSTGAYIVRNGRIFWVDWQGTGDRICGFNVNSASMRMTEFATGGEYSPAHVVAANWSDGFSGDLLSGPGTMDGEGSVTAADVPIESGSTGHAWINTSGLTQRISGELVVNGTPPSPGALTLFDTETADVFATARIKGSNTDHSGIVLRWVDNDNFFLAGLLVGSSQFGLWEFVNGTPVQRWAQVAGVNDSTYYDIEAHCDGSEIRVRTNFAAGKYTSARETGTSHGTLLQAGAQAKAVAFWDIVFPLEPDTGNEVESAEHGGESNQPEFRTAAVVQSAEHGHETTRPAGTSAAMPIQSAEHGHEVSRPNAHNGVQSAEHGNESNRPDFVSAFEAQPRSAQHGHEVSRPTFTSAPSTPRPAEHGHEVSRPNSLNPVRPSEHANESTRPIGQTTFNPEPRSAEHRGESNQPGFDSAPSAARSAEHGLESTRPNAINRIRSAEHGNESSRPGPNIPGSAEHSNESSRPAFTSAPLTPRSAEHRGESNRPGFTSPDTVPLSAEHGQETIAPENQSRYAPRSATHGHEVSRPRAVVIESNEICVRMRGFNPRTNIRQKC